LRSVADRLAPQLLWQGTDGSFAIASRIGLASRYFALRHPLPARRIFRRLQKRTSRIAALARVELLDALGRSSKPAGSTPPWWVDAAASALQSEVADWLMLSGSNSGDKSIGFLFSRGALYPNAVAKIASAPPAVARVERGYCALEQLAAIGATKRGLAPEPLAIVAGGNGEIASIESAVRGAWLDGVLRPGTEMRVLDRVTDWLIDLAVLTRGPERDDAWALLFGEVVDRFRENVAGLVDEGLLEAACSSIAAVKRIPTVFEHHDCAPWNFYVTHDERLVAFDWDNANPRGIPGFDLVQALGHVAFSVDGALRSRRFGESLGRREAGKLAVVRHENRARYASALRLDLETMCAIRVFAWMRLTNDELEASRRAGKQLRPEEVGRSILGAWIEEARSAIDS